MIIHKIAYRIIETYFTDEDEAGIEETEGFSVSRRVVDGFFF